MAREISRAEAWERAHTVFTQINFSAFDFATIKESLLDYVKLYFPEDFNDYIESSEFIAILEIFAYVGELLAYRIDINAHENFITTAQRKESILRLAKMISYKASRNIPARGLVKMTSIQTSESILDSTGTSLAGRRIFWNDRNNANWKEQFILIMNRVLEQDFGSVSPEERKQVDDVLFELYTFNNNPISSDSKSVFPFSTTVDGETVPMELVPVDLTSSGPQEKRPETNLKFTLLYGNDGLGDSSDTTGFMMFTKQGTLSFQTESFDGVTPNQTLDIVQSNINETDVWINNIDPETGKILVIDPYAEVLPHLVSNDLRYGEWVEVDLVSGQNIIFNTNSNHRKYEIETLTDDNMRIVFGDGEFSAIPSGTFNIWYRTSANKDFYIEKNSVVDQSSSFTYIDLTGSTQTLSFTFSLISSLQNSSASEDIEHIRRVAPSVYYTQDRMVNGRDYNTYMLQDPSIIRMRAINRTFAGDSKYIAWHDPRESYEDVKIFGDDLGLYWVEESPQITPPTGALKIITTGLDSVAVLEDYIEPLLSSTDFFSKIGPVLQEKATNVPESLRRSFNTASQATYSFGTDSLGFDNERSAIIGALNAALTTTPDIELWYSIDLDEWTVGEHTCSIDGNNPNCAGTTDSTLMIIISSEFNNSTLSGWSIRWLTRRLIAHSESTKFWNTRLTESVVNFDTLNSVTDELAILKANPNSAFTGLLPDNIIFGVVAQEQVTAVTPNSGLPDIHRLSVLPVDNNNDGIPDDLVQPDLFDGVFNFTYPIDEANIKTGELPLIFDGTAYYVDLDQIGENSTFGVSYDKGYDYDIEFYHDDGTGFIQYQFGGNLPLLTDDYSGYTTTDIIRSKFRLAPSALLNITSGDAIRIKVISHVYVSRADEFSDWIPSNTSDIIKTSYLLENTTPESQRYNRYLGRYPLNFAWMHSTARLNLVDPAASNIIDIFITSSGFYTGMQRWLQGKTDIQPTPPTPLELRTTYATLLENKMISDTVVLQSGNFKILFGPKATPQLRSVFKIVRPTGTLLTDNQVKVRIVEVVRKFFDINDWEYGEKFYFTEMASAIHADIGPEIDSFVLVPLYANNRFGDMFQITAAENELFLPDINTTDIEIVQSLTPSNIRQA